MYLYTLFNKYIEVVLLYTTTLKDEPDILQACSKHSKIIFICTRNIFSVFFHSFLSKHFSLQDIYYLASYA
jgi:hypothetical protein